MVEPVPKEEAYTGFGWDRKRFIFRHPAFQDQIWLPDRLNKLGLNLDTFRNVPDYEPALKFIKAQIQKGTLLGTTYVLGMTSLLLKFSFSFMPFSVFITGGSRGKRAIIGKFIQNAFLPDSFDVNPDATIIGLDRVISSLNNMPVWIDWNDRRKDKELEKLVLIIALGKGRARATSKGDVIMPEISSIVFFTLEQKKRAFEGKAALRRFLTIPAGVQKVNIPVHIRHLWGHGLVIAKFLMDRLQREGKSYIQRLEEKAKQHMTEELTPFYHILTTSMAGSYLVEDALEVSCAKVRQRVLELVKQQKIEFEK